jgi:predicted GNAT family N-acyltransferase
VSISLHSPQTQQQWDAYYEFRWQMLRKPWKQPRGSERDEYESGAFHLIAVDANSEIVGIGRLHPIDKTTAQIRYMAVSPQSQRQGIGNKILNALERQACVQQYQQIILNARNEILGFYASNGYQLLGPGHTLFGEIAHTKMKKILNC